MRAIDSARNQSFVAKTQLIDTDNVEQRRRQSIWFNLEQKPRKEKSVPMLQSKSHTLVSLNTTRAQEIRKVALKTQCQAPIIPVRLWQMTCMKPIKNHSFQPVIHRKKKRKSPPSFEDKLPVIIPSKSTDVVRKKHESTPLTPRFKYYGLEKGNVSHLNRLVSREVLHRMARQKYS